jgi:DNA-binding SARP family transcriptional activator
MIELLTKVPLFAPLTKREIKFLAGIARQIEYPAKTVLFREGEYGDRLYIIIEGQLDIVKALGKPEEHVLRVCADGDYIGEMCFLNPGGIRSASVVSRTAVRLLEISRVDFETLLRRRPAITFAIACGLTERLVDSEDKFLRTLANNGRESNEMPKIGKPEPDLYTGVHNGVLEEQSAFEGRATPLLEVKTLGAFAILRAAAPIELEGKGKLPILLLKAIINHGETGVPKDVLIEDLWEETAPASAERNFKVTLHRLRKVLEPFTKRAHILSYIVLDKNLVSLRKELCKTDVDEFLTLCSQGKKAEQAGDADQAIIFNRSAIDLYKGNFLAEDLYALWAEPRRRELRAIYVDLLSRTAELHEVQGSSKKAAECYKLVVKADPVNECAYQKLMQIYSNRGMRAEAITIYDECKKALKSELGVKPGELTMSIYRKIAAEGSDLHS